MLSDQFFWFATRSAGLLTWFAAMGSVGVGLLMSTRALGRKPTIPWLLDVHRFLSAASIVFLALHLVTLWADDFIDFGPAELFIPGRAQVGGLSDLALALGVVAAWIMLIVEASSLIKNRLPKRLWHTVHLTSFGAVILGLIHGIEVGSDTDNRVLVAAAVSVLTAILILTATRVSRVLSDRKHRYELELESTQAVDDFADLSDVEELGELDPVRLIDDFARFGDLGHFDDFGVGAETDELAPVRLYETIDHDNDEAEPVRAARYPPPERRSGRVRRQDDVNVGEPFTTDW